MTARRRWPSFERVYDLPERMIPAEVLARPTPDPADAQRELLALAARFCGVATGNDLADYFRLNKVAARPLIADLAEAGRLVPVEVEGGTSPPTSTPTARRRRAQGRALLAPFDSLVWNRERTERIFRVPAAGRALHAGVQAGARLLRAAVPARRRLVAASTSRPTARRACCGCRPPGASRGSSGGSASPSAVSCATWPTGSTWLTSTSKPGAI